MKIDHKKTGQATVTFTNGELVLLNNALNEICHNIAMDDDEFHTRIGIKRKDAQSLLADISRLISEIGKG